MRLKETINGIILAGGRSSRMGRPKGLLTWQGTTFIDCCRKALEPLVNDIILVSDLPVYDGFDLKRVEDKYKDAGPLAGLHAGLSNSEATYNLVLSCDIPMIDTGLLRLLVDELQDDLDVVYIESNGQKMPLIGLYHRSCACYFEKQLIKGDRKLMRALEGLQVKSLELDKKLNDRVKNINTIGQYNELQHETDD